MLHSKSRSGNQFLNVKPEHRLVRSKGEESFADHQACSTGTVPEGGAAECESMWSTRGRWGERHLGTAFGDIVHLVSDRKPLLSCPACSYFDGLLATAVGALRKYCSATSR